MNEQPTARFDGWAIVEIMGHQRVAGMVTTEAFGSVVMFRVTAPEVPETEVVIEQDGYFEGHLLGKGSRIASGRPRVSTLVGAGSVYRLTECTEAEALVANPLVRRVIERVERKQLSSGAMFDDDADTTTNDEQEVPY